jgi:hypothetical protein
MVTTGFLNEQEGSPHATENMSLLRTEGCLIWLDLRT